MPSPSVSIFQKHFKEEKMDNHLENVCDFYDDDVNTCKGATKEKSYDISLYSPFPLANLPSSSTLSLSSNGSILSDEIDFYPSLS